MNQSKVKKIRNNMHYPHKRTYHKDAKGTIHADEPRKAYQRAKKEAMKNGL